MSEPSDFLTKLQDDEQITLDCFPFDFRTYQRETVLAIRKTFLDGKRFCILEAPTGSGKSALGITFTRLANSSYIITGQKILQQQYMRDYGEELVELRGRNEYECVKSAEHSPNGKPMFSCAEGICRQLGEFSLKECVDFSDPKKLCPYKFQVLDAQHAKNTVFNFQGFFCQRSYAYNFGKRELLVVDEAHNIESQIMNFVEISISDYQLRAYGIMFPRLETVAEYLEFFEMPEMQELLDAKISEADAKKDVPSREYWERIQKRLKSIKKEVESSDYVVEYKEENAKKGNTYHTVAFKPLYVNNFVDQCLFDGGQYVILMSATILNPTVFCENLGIDSDRVGYVSVPSTFPPTNRPIYVSGVGSMSYKCRDETLPRMITMIEKILSHHVDQRGIIHTHSFKNAQYIIDNISQEHKNRLFFQKDYKNRQEVLTAHAKQPDGVLVAPAMHEGLDLKDDLSRFQIIMKIPYPDYTTNKQLAMRMNRSNKYYSWLTALKLIQCYGRSVRSETDTAITYLLDSDFTRFYYQNKEMIPEWFRTALFNLDGKRFDE